MFGQYASLNLLKNKKEEFEDKVAMLKKALHGCCLFCETMVESKKFPPTERRSVLVVCEFCWDKCEVYQQLERELTETKKELNELKGSLGNEMNEKIGA